ncbi:MAG: TonB-dependent receptor [Balneolaceae bacterium]|nr:TonB-dependent receptor [Balneolaceae bacterium]
MSNKILRPLSCVLAMFVFTGVTMAQTGTLTGTVTDSEINEPLPGANILLEEIERGAASDLNGEFTLDNIPYGTYTAVVTFIGYSTTTIEITIDQDVVQQDFQIEPDHLGLDEVVVIGYGTRDRRDLTGSVARVSAEDLASSPLSNLESGLAGRAAGVQVSTASGLPGGEVAVRVRGAASIGAGNQPLYVVDGVPITTRTTSSSLAGNASEHTTSALADLNPADIESMEVLKDAAATAIYGSRAANGVVLITTKRGIAQQTEISVNHYSGIATETERLNMLDGPQYVTVTREAGVAGSDAFPDPNNAPTYDWADAVHRSGYNTQTDISLRGGDENTRFYVGGTFFSQEGYLIENKFQRSSARVNLDHSVSPDFRIGANFSVSQVDNNRVGSDNLVMGLITSSALNAPIRPIYLDDGSFNTNHIFTDADGNVMPGTIQGNIAFNTVQEAVDNRRELESLRLIGGSFFEWDIASNLELRGSFSVDNLAADEFYRYLSQTGSGAPDGDGQRRNESTMNWIAEAYLTYITDLSERQSLNAVGGLSYQSYRTEGIYVSGTNFPSDLFPNVASAAEMSSFTAYTDEQWGIESYFSRLTYSFDDRYILEASARVDGSSRFGADNQYGFFPAGSFAWRLTNESFMQNQSFFDDLRVRASYGLLGNDNIGDFASRGLWAGNANYAGQPGLQPSQLESPELKWEQTSQLDVGLDLTTLNERLAFSADYYYKYTTDMLLDVPLPYTSGFSSVQDNIGEMKNYGFEFTLDTQNITGAFQWTTNFNITFNRNEVVNLVGDEPILGIQNQRAEEGHPLGVFYLQEWAGVDSETGLPQWYVVDEETGDRTTTNNYGEATRQHVGSAQPDFFGGFTNTFSYAGFDLSVFFQYVYGNKIYWQDGTFLLNPVTSFNKSTDILERWQSPGDVTDVPRFRDDDGNPVASTQASTRFLQDGSYLRLKDVTLNYSFPAGLVENLGLRNVNVYLKGVNLLTFTSYEGLDPELAGHGDTTLGQGVSFFTPPQGRTIMAGVRFSL